MSVEVIFSVYIITNLTNGKRYVGVSCRPFERWKQHIRGENGTLQTQICRAIRKYGKENFEFKVLSEFSSKKEAMNEEIRLISIYKPEYNQTLGGESGSPRLGMKNSPEHCARISASNKGRVHSPEVRANNSRARRLYLSTHPIGPMTGKRHSLESIRKISIASKEWASKNPNPFKGKRHTAESKEKMSSSLKQIYLSKPGPRKGVKHTAETKQKMSDSARARCARDGGPMLGKKHSPESLKRMSEVKIGISYHTPETRRKVSEQFKGKKLSAEHRAAISKARKGWKMPDEQKARISAMQMGSKRSPEIRQKLSDGMKRSWELRKKKLGQ